jgi:hypothetical protein
MRCVHRVHRNSHCRRYCAGASVSDIRDSFTGSGSNAVAAMGLASISGCEVDPGAVARCVLIEQGSA